MMENNELNSYIAVLIWAAASGFCAYQIIRGITKGKISTSRNFKTVEHTHQPFFFWGSFLVWLWGFCFLILVAVVFLHEPVWPLPLSL